jgi:hypothetical protein
MTTVLLTESLFDHEQDQDYEYDEGKKAGLDSEPGGGFISLRVNDVSGPFDSASSYLNLLSFYLKIPSHPLRLLSWLRLSLLIRFPLSLHDPALRGIAGFQFQASAPVSLQCPVAFRFQSDPVR